VTSNSLDWYRQLTGRQTNGSHASLALSLSLSHYDSHCLFIMANSRLHMLYGKCQGISRKDGAWLALFPISLTTLGSNPRKLFNQSC
jgi:hypothetical protein